MFTPRKSRCDFAIRGFIHDLVRDSLRQALLATRPVAAFPMAKSPRGMPVDTDAAEVAEKLEEEPAAGQGARMFRTSSTHRGLQPIARPHGHAMACTDAAVQVVPSSSRSRGRSGSHSRLRFTAYAPAHPESER